MSYRTPMGEMLKGLRKTRHLRQEDIADILHIKRQTYCKMEKNQQRPSAEQIAILSDLYEENLSKFIMESMPDEYVAEYKAFKSHLNNPKKKIIEKDKHIDR